MFGHEIRTAIGSLRHHAIGKDNAQDERMNRIKTGLLVIKPDDNCWRNALHSWAQGQEQ
jgi:hypothetical protein